MAMTLLDGFDATVSVKTQGYSGGVLTGTPVEHACWLNTLTLNFQQDVITISKVTFCTTPGAKKKAALERDIVGTMSGLASKGDPASTPGALVNGTKINIAAVVDDPTPVSAGSDVCSVVFDAFINNDLIGMIAKGNSSRAMAFESTGAWATAWVNA